MTADEIESIAALCVSYFNSKILIWVTTRLTGGRWWERGTAKFALISRGISRTRSSNSDSAIETLCKDFIIQIVNEHAGDIHPEPRYGYLCSVKLQDVMYQ